MKDWIMELCPEIAEWQADLIAEQVQKEIAAEREACAKYLQDQNTAITDKLAAEIRARGQV